MTQTFTKICQNAVLCNKIVYVASACLHVFVTVSQNCHICQNYENSFDIQSLLIRKLIKIAVSENTSSRFF
ncbi:MAG: hypothetical protein ACRCUY_03625, partial [Thermoguttaceae bacterium]